MDKRDFLKSSGALVTGALLSKLSSGQPPDTGRTNWSGNYTYRAEHLDLADNVDDIRRSFGTRSHLKILGARHSFNSIADSSEDQISLKALNQMVLDPENRTVIAGAGVTYGQLAP